MEVRIVTAGDSSAGIPSWTTEFELGIEPSDVADYEDIRKTLEKAFAEIYGGAVHISLFSPQLVIDVLDEAMHVLDMIRLSASWDTFPLSAQNMVVEALLKGKIVLRAWDDSQPWKSGT